MTQATLTASDIVDGLRLGTSPTCKKLEIMTRNNPRLVIKLEDICKRNRIRSIDALLEFIG